MRKNILPRKLAKPIEQLSDGTWIIRYAIQSIDRTDNEGNELVTYASSIFLEKPTLEMIKKSIHRYAMSVLDDEDVLTGALSDVAVDVEQQRFVVAVVRDFLVREDRVGVGADRF